MFSSRTKAVLKEIVKERNKSIAFNLENAFQHPAYFGMALSKLSDDRNRSTWHTRSINNKSIVATVWQRRSAVTIWINCCWAFISQHHELEREEEKNEICWPHLNEFPIVGWCYVSFHCRVSFHCCCLFALGWIRHKKSDSWIID